MPRDTPPPISKEILDEWYAKRRAARNANANDTPLGGPDRMGRNSQSQDKQGQDKQDQDRKQPPVPIEAKTVYEAKPMVRDLRKEAASAFMPTAVRMKMEKSKGQSGLMEPEEADRLEREGYLKSTHTQDDMSSSTMGPPKVSIEDVEDDQD